MSKYGVNILKGVNKYLVNNDVNNERARRSSIASFET